MRSTRKEEILSVKEYFERWEGIFGVNNKRYHADLGSFTEQQFRDAVDEANPKTTLCGVGYHHKMLYLKEMPKP